MMNIREYFANAQEEEENAVFTAWENGTLDLNEWAKAHNVNLDAVKIVNNEEIAIVTLWAWDMIGE